MADTETSKKLRELLVKAVVDKKLTFTDVNLEHPTDSKFGDYSTNMAMILAKRDKGNPAELAKKIIGSIKDEEIIEKLEVAGNGFINIFLKKDFLKQEAEKINYEIEFNKSLNRYGKGKTMVIDYSSPNIAKPFGIGHLRSTNIGQALYNIYKILGWNCIGDNHLGDWGTQFGKMITALKHWGKGNVDKMTIADLEELYVRFHAEAEAEKDKTLDDEAREWFAKLEKGDGEAKKVWQECVDISIKEFNRVYEMLGVKIDNAYGEAFYVPMLPKIIKEVKEKKLAKESQGALIVELENMTPAMLLKSDGATTYFTRDLATIKFREEKWHPDLIIYEVGSEQNLYFKQVFAIAKLMGWKTNFVHIGHGLIRWKEGKFSTRKGDTIHLEEVIDKAMEEAKKIAPDNTKEKIVAVAIGAIKFNDLSSDPKKDVIFDWERVMSMDGNSGPYLQYTYARCMSVLGKTEIKEQKNIGATPEIINDEELGLIREFYKFEEKIIEAAQRFNPGVIAEYLLTIARKYNEFYGKHRIIGEPEETWRIFLTKVTSNILKTGLGLLGIETIEKM